MGLSYETSTQMGVTDSNGYFDYVDGESVTFTLGDILLGVAEGKDVVTPVDFIEDGDTGSPYVINVARLLQTLDSDPTDSLITIPAGVLSNASGASIADLVVDLDFRDDENFDIVAEEIIRSLVSELEEYSMVPGLVSAVDAQHHLEVSLGIAGNNHAPVAHSGDDQSVYTDVTITLDGSSSSDSDGDSLSYSWSFISKPAESSAVLVSDNTVAPTFVADIEGTYEIQLVVTDGTTDSDSHIVTIVASAVTTNTAPQANAGPDQSVDVGLSVTLDGSESNDADGDEITYSWSLHSRPAGSDATLTGAATVAPVFYADIAGGYEVQLVVNDGESDSVQDTVVVIANAVAINTPPVAVIGPDQAVTVGTLVSLSEEYSFDADGDLLTYQWVGVKPAGSLSALSTTTEIETTFTPDVAGSYEIELIVNDGTSDSSPVTAVITVTEEIVNAVPVASAGLDQSVSTGTTVNLDGSGSSDPDGDSISYLWSWVSAPSGSAAILYGSVTASPTFVPDLDGTYVLNLVVNDGTDDSEADTITVTSTTVVTPPPTNVYSVTVTREGQDLYDVIGQNSLIVTNFCYEYVYSDSALLYGSDSIVFSNGDSCDVDTVYGKDTTTPAGNYSVTISREDTNWYEIHYGSGGYIETSLCLEIVHYDNAVLSMNGYGGGTLIFSDGDTCQVSAVYVPLAL